MGLESALAQPASLADVHVLGREPGGCGSNYFIAPDIRLTPIVLWVGRPRRPRTLIAPTESAPHLFPVTRKAIIIPFSFFIYTGRSLQAAHDANRTGS